MRALQLSEGDKMDKKIEIAILLDLYRGLLTDKQAEATDLYYNEDLSLSEIAENINVTRQAVRDFLVKAERILKDAEEKTGLGARIKMLEDRLRIINETVKSKDAEMLEKIAKLSEIGE